MGQGKEDGIKMRVEVIEQGFGAILCVSAPEDSEEWVTRKQCEEKLQETGIIFGIDREMLKNVVDKRLSEPVKIARGIKPRPGKKAKLQLHFVSEKKVKPRERDDGTVDYHNLEMVESVDVGQLLATKEPPTPGEAGMTVRGDEIEGPYGKDFQLRAGNGAVLDEEGLRVHSEASGHPVCERGNRISVYPIYRVKRNVDFGVGNVDFVGTVHIGGGVASGFTVKARGDIQVGGSSSAEQVTAGQDVIVGGGIQGLKRGRVEAGRDVRARFIENAYVMSERNVHAGSILHSQVECRGRVEVSAGKGLIAGGAVRAGEAVVAKAIGTPLATPTEIQVGTDPVVRKEMAKAVNDAKECERQILQLEAQKESINSLQAFKGDDKQRAQTQRLERRLRLLREHFEELNEIAERLTEVIDNSDKGLVKADIVHPGVRIHVGLSTMFVDETRRNLHLQPGSSELVKEESPCP